MNHILVQIEIGFRILEGVVVTVLIAAAEIDDIGMIWIWHDSIGIFFVVFQLFITSLRVSNEFQNLCPI